MVSAIWTDYEGLGDILQQGKLNMLIIENDDAYIVATNLYSYIVAMKANKSNCLGIVKIHLETLVKFLYNRFSNFKDVLEKSE